MRRGSLHELPEDLPVPVDDGACDHLPGVEMPAMPLPSTAGGVVNLAEASREKRTVFFFYPRAGRADEPPIPGWDDIPGARGCTPQSCAFRDRFAEFEALGVQVFGMSAQDTEYQREFAQRTHLPYRLLSDAAFASHGRDRLANIRSRRNATDQTANARRLEGAHREGVLSGVPAGQERSRGARISSAHVATAGHKAI